MSKIVVFVDDFKIVLLTAQMAVKPLVEKGNIEFKSYEKSVRVLRECKKWFSL